MNSRGRELLLQAYAKPKPRRQSIKRLLHCLFHTKDDEFVDECLKACKGSSFRLLGYVGKDIMPKLSERAIGNLALLVCQDEDGKSNKTHQAKKQFSLLCTIMNKAMDSGDHNTAWIVDKALRSMAVQKMDFKRPKRFKGLIEKVDKAYGIHDRIYAKHVYRAIQAHAQDQKEFIPAATVLDLYVRKSQAHRKAMQQNGCRKEWIKGAERGNRIVEEVIDFYKITLSQNTHMPLIKLYTKDPAEIATERSVLLHS